MMPPPLSSAGWTLTVAGASADGARWDYHLIGRGEDFSAPRRGVLALIASGDPHGPAPGEAASLAGALFTEGYFGALATLAPVRAAARALDSTNAWLFRQSSAEAGKQGMAVSLAAAILPPGGSIYWLHIGDNRIYLRRNGTVQALAPPHTRRLTSGAEVLTRGIGIDRYAQAEWIERQAEPGDRIFLISASLFRALGEVEIRACLTRDAAPEALAHQLAAAAGLGTALIVDIDLAPAPTDDVAAEFADLPVRPPPDNGELLDGFLIGRTIYRSQYTLLKRAHDTIEDRDVVLKWPLPAMAQDQVFKQGFLREAWIGARIRSRWTVNYFDLPPERRSALYLVMPFYRGVTLAERLESPPPVTIAEGVGVGLSLCDAIEDLARKQVIHADIKPENIFLLSNGEIKLLDLGLAALPGLDDVKDDRLGGTTRYMAPELFRGSPPAPASEVFSLGVTLYRLFSGGAFPFGQREKAPLARLRPDLPRWLGRVLARAIEHDPSARYPDVGALRAELLHGLAHEDWRGPPQRRRELSVAFWRSAAIALAFGMVGLAFLALRR